MNKSVSLGCGQRFFASELRCVSNKASESRLGIEQPWTGICDIGCQSSSKLAPNIKPQTSKTWIIPITCLGNNVKLNIYTRKRQIIHLAVARLSNPKATMTRLITLYVRPLPTTPNLKCSLACPANYCVCFIIIWQALISKRAHRIDL